MKITAEKEKQREDERNKEENDDNMDTEDNIEQDKESGDDKGSTNEAEPKLNYTKEKLFHCVITCNKGKATIFTFPKEYVVTATVMIVGLIPYTKHLYGDESKKCFGWNALGREDRSCWCKKTYTIISPNDKMVRSALQNDLWWMTDELATGAEDQIDPMAMPSHPEHDIGCNKTIANERQVDTVPLSRLPIKLTFERTIPLHRQARRSPPLLRIQNTMSQMVTRKKTSKQQKERPLIQKRRSPTLK
jgi:hypothetical protein